MTIEKQERDALNQLFAPNESVYSVYGKTEIVVDAVVLGVEDEMLKLTQAILAFDVALQHKQRLLEGGGLH